MADREQPYDPYIPSGGAQGGNGAQNGGNQRTAALQAVSPSRSRSIYWLATRSAPSARHGVAPAVGLAEDSNHFSIQPGQDVVAERLKAA